MIQIIVLNIDQPPHCSAVYVLCAVLLSYGYNQEIKHDIKCAHAHIYSVSGPIYKAAEHFVKDDI